MEVEKLLLKGHVLDKELKSFIRLTDNLKIITTNPQNTLKKQPSIICDIVFRIIYRDDASKISKIELLGLPGTIFLLSNPFFSHQRYNICYYCTAVQYLASEKSFVMNPQTKFRPLFYHPKSFLGLAKNIISDTVSKIYNVNFRQYNRNGFLESRCIRDFNSKSELFKLEGVIIKISHINEKIVLKLLDHNNFLDTNNIHMTFRSPDLLENYKNILQVGIFVEFDSNLRQNISKDLKIIYNVNIDHNSNIGFNRIKGLEHIAELPIRDRILYNIGKANFFMTETCNLSPYTFHRGICKLLVKVRKLYSLDIKLFCAACKLRNSRCRCIKPSFDLLKLTAGVIVQNSGINVYCIIKSVDDFFHLFEMDEKEIEFLFNYIRRIGYIDFKLGELVDPKSWKATLLTILGKAGGYRIVYGRFIAKVSSKSMIESTAYDKQISTAKSGLIFPNGLVKAGTTIDSVIWVFNFKIIYVDSSIVAACRDRFNYLRSKLLI